MAPGHSPTDPKFFSEEIVSKGYALQDFRFSGSYISRYHACHGSAVLAESLPGFERISGDRKATTKGTRLHTVFQQILEQCADLIEAAVLLEQLADVFGKNRIKLLKDERSYILWWFTESKTVPPVDHSIIAPLHEVIPAWSEQDEITEEWVHHAEEDVVTSPAHIRFIAECLRYVFEIIEHREGALLLMEETRVATWTQTKPKTTADLVISDGKTLDVIDFKTGSISVSVEYNEQLMYYAKTYRKKEKKINLHVLQPKNLVEWELDPETLEAWVTEVLASEKAILKGDRTLTPGTHCQFCPANPFSKGEQGSPKCPAQMEVLFGADDISVVTDDE